MRCWRPHACRTHCCALAALRRGRVAGRIAAPPPPRPVRKPATPRGRARPRQLPAATHLPAGRFGTVSVYLPQGRPRSVAIFLSGDGGWELGVINMARALRVVGALVIGVDIRQYFASLRRVAARARRSLPDDRRRL